MHVRQSTSTHTIVITYNFITVVVLCYLVTPPPPPVIHPMNKMVILLNNVTAFKLTCTTVGATKYKWQKYPRGGILPNITSLERHHSTLILTNLQPHYAGWYRCWAKNDSGKSYSKFANLTIKGWFIVVQFRGLVALLLHDEVAICLLFCTMFGALH